MIYPDFLELVKKRRKIIAFTDKEISNDDIIKIIDAARYAPSGMNFQPWEFVIIRDKKTIEEIAYIKPEEINIPFIVKIITKMKLLKKHIKMPPVTNGIKNVKNAQALIIACGDTRKCINLPGQKYKIVNGKIKLKKSLNIVDVGSIYSSSMSAAFIQMILAATSLGFGTQYITLTSSIIKEKKIKQLLKIPDYIKIYDTLAIGYPAYNPRKKYLRDLNDIIHYERYDTAKAQSDKYIIERALNREDMKFLK